MRSQNPHTGPVNAVELRELTVRFGRHVALEQVSLSVPQGAFLALIGPNGAGKSTLIRSLLGLVPYQGEVQVLGQVPGKQPQQVAYVPQLKTFDRSFPALARELVLTGARRRWPGLARRAEQQAADAALQQVGAAHLAGRRVGRLSGGELQRVYLARALLRRPQLLLFDEPATGIDTLGEQDLYALVEGAQREQPGLTVLMITHDLDVARHHASRVAVLNRRLISCGEPAQALCEECLALAYGHAGHSHLPGHRHASSGAR